MNIVGFYQRYVLCKCMDSKTQKLDFAKYLRNVQENNDVLGIGGSQVCPSRWDYL